eukprot:jgi/Chlat1/9236/Chrsp99S08513
MHSPISMPLLSLLLLLAGAVSNALATTWVVGQGAGASEQWDFGVNFVQWARGKTFHDGDSLVFKYPAFSHDVWRFPSASAFAACDFTKARQVATVQAGQGGGFVYHLNEGGGKTYWFGCSLEFGGHCRNGLKVQVTTTTNTSPPPPACKSRWSGVVAGLAVAFAGGNFANGATTYG